MASIQSLLNKITEFASRSGLASIGKGEFFDFHRDVVNKISEVNDNVNSVAKSLIFNDPVVAIVSTLPTTGLTVGQRYVLSTDNKIYTATSTTAFGAGVVPAAGWAVMVTALGYIYSYNGVGWKSTGLTAFPSDMTQVKSDTYVNSKELIKIKLIPNQVVSNSISSSWLSGAYYTTGGAIETFGGTSYSYQTDYIPMLPSSNYKYIGQFEAGRALIFYDENHNYLGLVVPSSLVTEFNFTTPANCAYSRNSCKTASLSTFQIIYLGAIFEKYAVSGGASKTLKSTEDLAALNQAAINNIANYPNKILSNVSISTWVSGAYYSTGGAIETFGGASYSYQTDFVPMLPSSNYKYIGQFEAGRAIIFYDENHNYLGLVVPSSLVTEFNFTTPANCAYSRSSCKTASISTFQIIYIGTETIILEKSKSDYVITAPTHIFGLDNDANGSNFYNREYSINLYPEGFLYLKNNIKLNGSRLLKIQNVAKNSTTKSTTAKSYELSGSGFIKKTGTFNFIKTKTSNAKNKLINVLTIGDSIAAMQLNYPDGVSRGGWCFHAIAKEISLMDNEDLGGSLLVNMLGTTNYKTGQSINYNSKTLPVRSFAEGRGGWAAATYLRHAILLTGSATDSGTNSTAAASGYASWDILGLTTTQGRAFSGSDADKNLIMSTVMGANAWNYSAYIFNFCKLFDQWTGGTGSYAGSGANNTAIDAMINYLLDNPKNPFYDKTKAQTGGATNAFSLTTYLNRFKTLSDDGITRLTVGSTAGSKVTDATAYDVCTPTHLVIELGENERWQFAPISDQIRDNVLAIHDVIRSEYAAIKIGFMVTHQVGPFYQSDWFDKGYFQEMNALNNYQKHDLQRLLQANVGDITAQTTNKKYLIPTYFTQSPISSYDMRYVYNPLNMTMELVSNSDGVHPGIYAYWDMAIQLLGWLYYTV